jgi:hypothetical protein
VATTSITVAGPVQWYAGISGTVIAPTFTFIGWTEGDTNISFVGEFEDVPTDYAGSRVPGDVSYMGQEARINGTLIRLNLTAYYTWLARIQIAGVSGGGSGSFLFGDIGTLMLAEKRAPGLVLITPYGSAKTVFTNVGSVAGYYFPYAWMDGPSDISASTKAQRQKVTVRGIAAFDPVTGNGTLVTTTQSSFPTLPGPS